MIDVHTLSTRQNLSSSSPPKTFPINPFHWASIAAMSQSPPQTLSSSNYQIIFDNALEAYKRKTGKDLVSDPLFHRLESSNSDTVLAVLRETIPGFGLSGSSGERLENRLNPTVNVLCTFSSTLGGAVSLVSLNKVKAIYPRLRSNIRFLGISACGDDPHEYCYPSLGGYCLVIFCALL